MANKGPLPEDDDEVPPDEEFLPLGSLKQKKV